MNSGVSLIKKELFWQLNIIGVVIMCCFKLHSQVHNMLYNKLLNCNIKAKNKCYTLLEKFHYAVKNRYVLSIYYQYC